MSSNALFGAVIPALIGFAAYAGVQFGRFHGIQIGFCKGYRKARADYRRPLSL
ncbi:MAG: hypothetical protein RLZZ244_217 [Verrucomicrobiota bacterium]|jgi:hypothetical protein